MQRFNMQHINVFLRSEAATLLLLTMALLAQLPHAAAVFHRLSGDNGVLSWGHAVSYAFALEFATLAFVVRGKRAWAWGFAGVSVAVNLAYYQAWTLQPWTGAQVALVSFALPVAIAMYSHDVARRQETPQKPVKRADSAKTPGTPTKRQKTPQKASGGKVQRGKAAIIREHHAEGLQAEEIANITGYNKSYISQTISRGKNGAGK